MIGGEMAAETAAAYGTLTAGDGYDLGWVMDWLYGDATVPAAPLPPVERSRQWAAMHGAATARIDGGIRSPRRSRAVRPRAARQMALL